MRLLESPNASPRVWVAHKPLGDGTYMVFWVGLELPSDPGGQPLLWVHGSDFDYPSDPALTEVICQMLCPLTVEKLKRDSNRDCGFVYDWQTWRRVNDGELDGLTEQLDRVQPYLPELLALIEPEIGDLLD
jgi:hypothetical protein